MEIVFIIILAVFVFDCHRRIALLEKRQKQGVVSSPDSAPDPVSSMASVRSVTPVTGQGTEVVSLPISGSSSETIALDRYVTEKRTSSPREQDAVLHFLGDDWLVKVGVLLLVLSLGWFVTYAFTHDWIGPIGRVTLGMLFGLVLVVAGTWRFSKSSIQGISLLSGGSASIYISIFAGMTMYHFYTPVMGLFFMGLMTAYMAILSGIKRSRSLSVATLMLGLIAPLFVFGSVEIMVLFVYLFILSAGIIAVDVLLGWRATTLATLVGVFLYSLISYANGDIERSFSSFVMILLFTLLFYGANIGMIISTRATQGYDLGVTALVGMTFFSWVLMTVDSDFIGMVFIGGALLFAISSFAVSSFFRLYEPMLLYASVAVAFLLAATERIFDGSLLAVLLAVEIGGLTLVSFVFLREKNFRVGRILTALLVWPVALSLENIQELIARSDSLSYGVAVVTGSPTEHLFVLVVMAGVFGAVAFAANRFFPEVGKKGEASLFALTKALSIGYILLFVWFFLHVIIPAYYVASMVTLILFTMAGLFFYARGTLVQGSSLRGIGLALFIIVLIRLFLVEFWTMSSVEKIITFFVVGALFLSTAFLLQKKVVHSDEINLTK